MDLPQIDDYNRLFLEDIPLLDVRAPVEYEQGAFPLAKNLPLINDQERHAIGVRYKEMGQEKAIELGHRLVSGDIKQCRIDGWSEFTHQYPQGALYCFRGGMRSKISQQWIFEHTGIVYPRVKGGYKALRRFLLNQLEAAAQLPYIILSGRTGVGKTVLLSRIERKVDLEEIYRHRGSAFGKHITPQPSQIDIENTLAIALLKQRAGGHGDTTKLVLEDEAPAIGSRRLPESIINAMKQSPLIVLEAGIEERTEIIFQEYILQALAEHQAVLGETQGFAVWAANLQKALGRIQRRLGGRRYQSIHCAMDRAIDSHRGAGQPQGHKAWIYSLLVEYYDPMYDYQLSRKSERVIFRGDSGAVLDFLKQQHGIR